MSNPQQTIELELSDNTTLNFNISRENYIKFINETNPKDKFSSMHNFLMRTVEAADKERLRELVKNAANVMDLAGEVLEEYKPDLAVVVKKRKQPASK